MPERRKHKRQKMRLKVEYGEQALDQKGLASDISLGGMFLDCRRGPSVGTRLHLHVMHPDRDFYVEGVVVRLLQGDPRLKGLAKEGVGIRFLRPEELIADAVPADERVMLTSTRVCPDATAVRKLIDEQLSSRIVVVPYADEPAAHEMLEFTIRVEIGETQEIRGQGRVLQLIGSSDSPQVVLSVDGADELIAQLEDLI